MAYQNSDQAFIDEWKAAIDLYGQTFKNLTLLLWAEPGFPNLSTAGFTVAGIPTVLKQDCPVVDMDCAAITQVLSHLVDPTVGGNNAKATSTATLTAFERRAEHEPWHRRCKAVGSKHSPTELARVSNSRRAAGRSIH